ncbi:MAG: hypothetical protein ACHQD8_01300 [Chitinophagales bacterium]
METQIINDNSCIRVVNDGTPLFLVKTQIKTIDTVKNEMVRIDIGEGALRHIYIKHADVTIPAGLADASALRDAIKAMLDTAQPGTDLTGLTNLIQTTGQAQTEGINAVKASVDALGQTSATLLTNMAQVLGQINQSLNAANISLSQPIRVDESVPMVVYNGYAVAIGAATADPVWAIQRITRNGDLFIYEWAGGNKQYTNIWDNRAALNYLPVGQ